MQETYLHIADGFILQVEVVDALLHKRRDVDGHVKGKVWGEAHAGWMAKIMVPAVATGVSACVELCVSELILDVLQFIHDNLHEVNAALVPILQH